jgi:sulfopyruvate decarboxylase alpha subunit
MKNAAPGHRKPSPVASHPPRASPSWPDQLHRVLNEQRVRQVAYVPDSGHARLIELVRADREMRAVPLTTEEEGVALAVGACLGGERSVLLLQSSGVGNCINMLGMVEECRVPLLMLVTMRGQWGEFNPWQVPMAQATVPSLAAMGVVVHTVQDADEIADTAAAAARLAFNTCRAVAVLIGQRVVGAKQFK